LRKTHLAIGQTYIDESKQEWRRLKMTQDEIKHGILQVCKVAGHDGDFNVVGFHVLCDKLKQLGADEQRERCAKLCEDDDSTAGDWHWEAHVGGYFARKIREEPEA